MMKYNDQMYNLHADQLGSIVAITDIGGNLVEQYAYSAFGQMKMFDVNGSEISNSQVGNIFGFTAREIDPESDLYYYRARYYSPNLGRFISADPIGFDGLDPNHFRYVFNSPILNKDPSGKIIPIIGPPIAYVIGYYIGIGINKLFFNEDTPSGTTIAKDIINNQIDSSLPGASVLLDPNTGKIINDGINNNRVKELDKLINEQTDNYEPKTCND